MALEAEVNALYQGIRAGTEGKTIQETSFDTLQKRVMYTLSNGVIIYQRIDDAIISALEA